MAGSLVNYTYTGTNGTSYRGQVVADPTSTKYNYVAGQSYAGPGGGSYLIDTAPGTPTTAPVGSVYQTAYVDQSGKSYDSYHYDAKNNAYYDINTTGYDHATGLYTPPPTAGTTTSTPVPAWSSKDGLGTEYAYVKTADGNYHAYGGGGTASAKITPDAIGLSQYDYKFLYPDGSYYVGRVVDDGTYGYHVGSTGKTAGGTYSIYATDPTPPSATALAGYSYTLLYHDASGTNYPPADIIPTSPYYNKPVGYGGVGTESDYVQKPGGYYAYSGTASAAASQPVAAVPLPT